MINLAQWSIIVLSVLILTGGLIGYLKAKSKASLIASIVSDILLIGCFLVSLANLRTGLTAALLVITCLDGVFISRLIRTKKFMPSGMLLILCIAEQAVLCITGFNHI